MRVELIWEANELVGAIIVSSIFASLATDIEAALKEEQAKGKERAETATAEYWLGSVYLYQANFQGAAPLLQHAFETRSKRFGENSVPVAEVIDKLAWFAEEPDAALTIMRRALTIREKLHGPTHILTLSDAGHLKDIYDAQGRTSEAGKMERKLEAAQ